MLFETLSQPYIFGVIALLGFLSGFVFDIGGFMVFICKKNKLATIILDFLASAFTFFIFYASVLKIDYGAFRFYHLFAFFSALFLQRITLSNIIAKFFYWCYNLFVNKTKKTLKRQNNTKEDEAARSNNSA